jgi:hypothetical protein
VILRLCRPPTNYESHELGAYRSMGLDVAPHDPSRLSATHTTAQDTANQAEKALAVEGERRQTLVTDANARLRT